MSDSTNQININGTAQGFVAENKGTVIINLSSSSELPKAKVAIPHKPYEPDLVLVSAGVFTMGDDVAGDWQSHSLELPEYRISLAPITNYQYAEFIKQRNYSPPKSAGWFGNRPPKDKLKQAVVGVTWYNAMAYCQWLLEMTERPYRLPTEAEWEKAVKQGFIVPSPLEEWTSTLWGEDWKTAQYIYPYTDERDDLTAEATFYRVYRSGPFLPTQLGEFSV